jgi:hypothetical protein
VGWCAQHQILVAHDHSTPLCDGDLLEGDYAQELDKRRIHSTRRMPVNVMLMNCQILFVTVNLTDCRDSWPSKVIVSGWFTSGWRLVCLGLTTVCSSSLILLARSVSGYRAGYRSEDLSTANFLLDSRFGWKSASEELINWPLLWTYPWRASVSAQQILVYFFCWNRKLVLYEMQL